MSDAQAHTETVGHNADRLETIEQRLKQLETENEQKDQRIAELEAKVEAQKQQPDVEMEPGDLDSLKVGGVPVGLALKSKIGESEFESLAEDLVKELTEQQLDDLQSEIRDARSQYSKQAAMLQKRFTALEDEVGVDTMELVTQDDHISRFIANGPEDVFPRVYEKQKRARKMLMNAKDWGQVVNDQLGSRVVFKASTVKPFLKTEYGREFNSTEVKRIFGVVEELGDMSTREVNLDKNEENQHRLAVWGVGE